MLVLFVGTCGTFKKCSNKKRIVPTMWNSVQQRNLLIFRVVELWNFILENTHIFCLFLFKKRLFLLCL